MFPEDRERVFGNKWVNVAANSSNMPFSVFSNKTECFNAKFSIKHGLV